MSVSRRPSVALATAVGWPDLASDDRALAPALARLGVAAETAIWTDPRVDWARFDLVVVRSCWDYHDDLPRWLAWIDALERCGLGSRLCNPPAVLRWNARKTYLCELARRGVPVVPTHCLRGAELGSWPALSAALEANGLADVVCKPAVSAGAFGTFRLRLGEPDASRRALEEMLPELARRGPLLVQPFLPEIAEEGEWSLLYFAGELSHAVVKRPAAGDFRVQEKHGGHTMAAPPPAELVRVAAEALAAASRALDSPEPAVRGSPFLYARVDLVGARGGPLLMELEVIEPALFLAGSAGPAGSRAAADRFAAAILDEIAAHSRARGDQPQRIT